MSNDFGASGGQQYMAAKEKELVGQGPRNPPVRMIVEAQIKEFELLIAQRKEFLASLDANPGIEDVLDKMRKLHL